MSTTLDAPLERSDADSRSMVVRIATILAAFRAGDEPLSVSEIARRTEIPKSTVSRIVRELVECRMLERAGRDIQPGIRLFELGESVERPHDLRRLTLGPMLNLRDVLGLTVHLAVLEDDEVLYLSVVPARADGYSPFRSRVARMPAHATAAGKALLAWSAPETVDRVASHPLKRVGPQTITDPDRLVRDLQTARREGYSVERGESRVGATCVAVPVLDAAGDPVVALSVTGRDAEVVLDEVVPVLHAAAAAVQRRILRAARLTA